jgi:hypothetical protein
VASGNRSSRPARCLTSNTNAVNQVECAGAVYSGNTAPFLLAMKYSLPLFLFTVLAASLALPQSNTAPSNTATAKKSQVVPGKTASKKAATKSASIPKKGTSASKKTASAKKGKASKKSVAVARQMAPTPERYKEIQQSLADKGYLKSEPNGVWDEQSMDALRQFQTEKKLSPTGKLSSASLIALGLGPKTAAASSGQPAPAETPPPASLPVPPAVTPEN